MTGHKRTFGTAAALALLLAACGGGAGGDPVAGDGTPTPPALESCRAKGPVLDPGDPLPDCTFERLEGGTLTLSDLKGTPLVLNFWASWCTFCIEEMPDFQAVYADLDGAFELVGIDLLGVSGETRAAAKRFAASTGVKYPLVYDEGGLYYANFSAGGRPLMPTTIFVGADGAVAFRQFGPIDEKRLRELLDEHLGVA